MNYEGVAISEKTQGLGDTRACCDNADGSVRCWCGSRTDSRRDHQYRDDNEYFESARFEAEMVIVSGSRQMVKTMTSYVQEDNGLVVFTNPRDRGTKFLKRGDDLWMFFPDAEDLVKISGHMLNQGIMGSDFSYQDVMEADKLTDLYAFELVGEEELDGRPCYVLEGIAVEGQDVSYYRRKSWIDSERFVGLREELREERPPAKGYEGH